MVLGIIQAYPLSTLLFFSFVFTLILTLAYKKFSDQNEIKASKQKIKELQARTKSEKDTEKLMALQKEMLEVNMNHMRHSMKPMMFTLIPAILMFSWLRSTYLPFGLLIPYSFDIPLFCTISIFRGLCDGAGWLVVYIFSGMFFNILLRKVMDVH